MKRLIPLAIIYDFDGTLAPGNMQERDFIPSIKMKSRGFWKEVSEKAKVHQADNILVYMKLMLDKANAAEIKVTRRDFNEYGRVLGFFEGILPDIDSVGNDPGWFERINQYGKESGIRIEHYIISSGIKEMIEGTPIAKQFKHIFASSFFYDQHQVAVWPAMAVNYTTKTQYLFRINKACLDVSDAHTINKYIPEGERAVPFPNMIYIGDGDTDIPCFRLVKDRGGVSIAVFKPKTKGAKDSLKHLVDEGRVNAVVPADYKNASPLDKIIKAMIDKMQTDKALERLWSTNKAYIGNE